MESHLLELFNYPVEVMYFTLNSLILMCLLTPSPSENINKYLTSKKNVSFTINLNWKLIKIGIAPYNGEKNKKLIKTIWFQTAEGRIISCILSRKQVGNISKSLKILFELDFRCLGIYSTEQSCWYSKIYI